MYTSIHKKDFGNVPLFQTSLNALDGVYTTYIPKLLLMQPSWVAYFNNVRFDKYSIFKVLMKLADEKQDELSELLLGYVKEYAKSLAHKTNNLVKLKAYEMDKDVIDWKHKILHTFYGNPYLPTKAFDNKNIEFIESLTKDEELYYNNEVEKVKSNLYFQRIPEDTFSRLDELLNNEGFIQYFTEEDELYHSLQYIKKENDLYMEISFDVDNKLIIYETNLDNNNKNIWLSFLINYDDDYLDEFQYKQIFKSVEDEHSEIEEVD